MTIDDAEKQFAMLVPELNEQLHLIETEADTRLQIIDRILIEVLGWPRSSILVEPSTEEGYADYLIKDNNTRIFIVEAKKIGKLIINTKLNKVQWYKANGAAVKGAKEGLNQATRYCSVNAVSYSALTSGLQWIGFWALRTDGSPPTDGKIAVFPSLDAIKSNFALFYDLFSREGIRQRLYQIHTTTAEGLIVQHNENLGSVIHPNDIRLLAKSSIHSDIEAVYKNFFSTMSSETDLDMLAKCFVESKESREADESLSKIAQRLIADIGTVESNKGVILQDEIKASLESKKGEFVLIVGNKGAGKTTFIDRFFRLVLDRGISKQCLVVRIDLADSNGGLSGLSEWLTLQFKDKLETLLFTGDGIPEYEELEGIFFKEYTRWKKGEHKYLYENDKVIFKQNFGLMIADMVKGNPELYVTRLFQHSIRSRSLMPCIVFDNTDHFPQEFQEAVFQYAQSIHRQVFSFIICPITDRSLWQLSKHGPFQSYETRAFYLPVPSTKEILEKRVAFIRQKAEDDPKESKQYFLERGIRLSISDMDGFAKSVEHIFIREDYIGKIIGWLSNHDIRRSLMIAQRIITSPIIGIAELLKAHVIGGDIDIKPRQVVKALILGDYNHFTQEGNDFVLNMFSMASRNVSSPLLKLSILRLLKDIYNSSADLEKAYLTCSEMINYFEPMGVGRNICLSELRLLLDYRLIEPYDPSESDLYDSQRLKIAQAGRMHYDLAFSDGEASYVSEMALTTMVVEGSYIDDSRELLKQKMDYSAWKKLLQMFAGYCLNQDERYATIPSSSQYDGQRALRRQFKATWMN